MCGRETRDLIHINFIILNVEPNVLAIVFSVCIRKYNIAIYNLQQFLTWLFKAFAFVELLQSG